MLMALTRQFIVFCGVGILNTAFSLAIILGLSEIAGVYYIYANIIGYAVGLAFGFLMHRGITFSAQANKHAPLIQVRFFLLVFAIAYAIQLVFLIVLVDIMGWGGAIAQIAACGLYALISFAGNRQLTFKAKT